eukprot:GHVT01049587.1.p2 GENE.GHVT01049587.1~~GHVT01049587.1.p2  ORF type:complete len:112 (+),score=11.28 GHVT01049587.1:2626-2961(+)
MGVSDQFHTGSSARQMPFLNAPPSQRTASSPLSGAARRFAAESASLYTPSFLYLAQIPPSSLKAFTLPAHIEHLAAGPAKLDPARYAHSTDTSADVSSPTRLAITTGRTLS